MVDYEKQMIGFLIGYYRKVKNKSVQEMISNKSCYVQTYCGDCNKKCRQKEGISSHKTLEKIERGNVSKNECFYHDFAYKLGYHYELSYFLTKRLEQLSEELVLLILTKSNAGYERLREKVRQMKREVTFHIYYQEMVMVMECTIDVELDGKYCHKSFLSVMEYLYPYVRGNMKKIFIYYLYLYSFHHNYKAQVEYYVSEAKLYFKENAQILFLNKLLEKGEFDTIVELGQRDISCLPLTSRYFYYQTMALAYKNLSKHKNALDYIEKCVFIAKQRNMIKKYYYQSIMRKGVILYDLSCYTEALDCFVRVFYFDINLLMLNIILMIKCFKELGREEEIYQLFKSTNSSLIHTKMISVFYNYYKMKYYDQQSASVLEDYIIMVLRPYLQENKDYGFIILGDLIHCIRQTKHYKKLWEYIF